MADTVAASPEQQAEVMTPDDAAAMTATLAAYNNRRMAEDAAARTEHMKPLTDFLASPAYAEVRAAIGPLARQYVDEPFYDSLRALDQVMGSIGIVVR
jgi:hypothetical protein